MRLIYHICSPLKGDKNMIIKNTEKINLGLC